MTLMARYSGTCPECDQRWQPGDLIRSDRSEPSGLPVWCHASCPQDEADLTLPPGVTEACPACFLIHPKGACDR